MAYKWTELTRQERNILIAEEVMGLKQQVDFGVWEEHDWYRTEDGHINEWAMHEDEHNGPACKRCWYFYCVNCEDGQNEPCEVEVSDYTTTLVLARKMLDKFSNWQITRLRDADGQEGKYRVLIDDNTYCAFADDEIEAICLATLKASGVDIE